MEDSNRFHCATCMDVLGLARGSGKGWVENVPCMQCGKRRLCERGRKKVKDFRKFFAA